MNNFSKLTSNKLVLMLFVHILFMFIVKSANASENEAISNYKIAKSLFERKDYIGALKKLEKVDKLLDKKNARVLALQIQVHFKLRRYLTAKRLIKQYKSLPSTAELSRIVSGINNEINAYLFGQKMNQADFMTFNFDELDLGEGKNLIISGFLTRLIQGPAYYKFKNIPSGLLHQSSEYSLKAVKREKRTVFIKSFMLLEHEVTWEMYSYCTMDQVCPDITHLQSDEYESENPVVGVSWNDVVNFYIPWLNKLSDLKFRLPTAEEWEYASGISKARLRGWPAEIFETQVNCKDCGVKRSKPQILPVKSLLPNEFEVFDMIGNVAELTSSCAISSFKYEPEIVTESPNTNCGSVVIRGGIWTDDMKQLKTFDLLLENDKSRNIPGVGFRLVLIE